MKKRQRMAYLKKCTYKISKISRTKRHIQKQKDYDSVRVVGYDTRGPRFEVNHQ